MTTITKPSRPEEEYFAKEEAEKLKRLALAKQTALQAAEKQNLKDLHWMHCPKCGMDLQPVVFKGVTIDKCFGCNGVFLDDGELEKVAGDEGGILKGMLGFFK